MLQNCAKSYGTGSDYKLTFLLIDMACGKWGRWWWCWWYAAVVAQRWQIHVPRRVQLLSKRFDSWYNKYIGTNVRKVMFFSLCTSRAYDYIYVPLHLQNISFRHLKCRSILIICRLLPYHISLFSPSFLPFC